MASRSLIFSFTRRTIGQLEGWQAREPVAHRPVLRSLSFALIAGLGYYVGSRIGFALTPSGQPLSIFWPANAILLAALLLAPSRSWWILLLAVLPAHMIVQLEVGVPIRTAAAWFLTNTSEALIGALCITRLIDPRRIFESVRGVFIFVIFGVLVAPLLTSFLDAAAVVLTGWGHGYLPIGAERFWTNVVAQLTIVPLVVLGSSKWPSSIRTASLARYCEAGLLGLAAILVTAFVFGLQPVSLSTIPATFYAPLLILIWATARFGSAGVCLCMLIIALTAIWYLMHGQEPFPTASLRQNVLSLQILLCSVALPLLFLSAYMTEARHTQQSLRELAANLIEAQEQERTRIGRELHDDVNQRLAMLAVEIDQLPENPLELQSRVQELRRQTIELSQDVQALSHDLHSSRLEYLGVVPGMSSWCKEFAERRGVEVDFTSEISRTLPFEVGICLFRVLQEAVHNAIKHSGVKRIEVQLREDAEEIYLTISDLGKGFDVDAATGGKGLGLTSMRERVRLAQGHFSIHSTPTRGTTIEVRVPLESKGGSDRAA